MNINDDDVYIPTEINFTNIGIKIDENEILDMNSDESMLVHQKNNKFSLIVGERGVSINTSRLEAIDAASNTKSALYVDGNIHTTGSIITNRLILNGVTLESNINSNILTELIQSINNNILPIHSGHEVNNENNINFNIYSTSYLTIGDRVDTIMNTNPLNIVESAYGKIERLQLNIKNNTEKRLSIGILGNADVSPAIIFTDTNKPLHFHIAQQASLLSEAYELNDGLGIYDCNTMPQLAIDIHKSVVINNLNSKQISYNKYGIGSIIQSNLINNVYPNLYVDGTAYITDIIIKDSYSGVNKHLDDIYIRKEGYTIKANQIIPGAFNGSSNYSFENGLIVKSNLIIEDLLATKSVTIEKNLNVESNVIIKGITRFHNELIASSNAKFLSGIEVSDDLILAQGSFVYDKTRININNMIVNTHEYNYSFDKIITYFENKAVSNSNIIASNIHTHLTKYGTSNVYTILSEISDNIITNQILIQILTDYSVLSSTTESVFTYARDDILNIDNSNLFIPGRLGVGIGSTQTTCHPLKISKKNIDNHQILLEYIPISDAAIYSAYIGHTSDEANHKFNSFSIITNNIPDHNIEFYAGIDSTLTNLTTNIIPTLIITTNKCVGINTDKPSHTLDIQGDIRYDDAYKTLKTRNYKVINFLEIDNIIVLENKEKKIGLNIDQNIATKALNVGGGINSVDGFFEGTSKLEIFKEIDSESVYLNKNIAIGWTANTFNANTTLQLRNISREPHNETLIRLYRGIQDGINNATFTGLEFCPYATDSAINQNKSTNYKWYIYTDHLSDTFDIGYINNGEKTKAINIGRTGNDNYHVTINGDSSEMNIDPETAMTINGDVIIKGNINVIGSQSKYLLNNVGFYGPTEVGPVTSNSSILSLTLSEKDISIHGNKIILIATRDIAATSASSTVFIGDNTLYFTEYMKAHALSQTVANQSGNLLVFQRNCLNNKPCATFTTANGNTLDTTLIRIGILKSVFGNTINDYAGLIYEHTLDLSLKGTTTGTLFETKISDSHRTPQIVSSIFKKKNNDNVNIKYGNTSRIVDKTYFHIENNGLQDLLQLTNSDNTPSIVLNNSMHYWKLSGPSTNNQFKIAYHTGIQNVINSNPILTPFVITSDGKIGINKPDNINAILDINSSNSGIACVRMVNNYSEFNDIPYIGTGAIVLSNIEKATLNYTNVSSLNVHLEIDYTNITSLSNIITPNIENILVDYTLKKTQINCNYIITDCNVKTIHNVAHNVSNLLYKTTKNESDYEIIFEYLINETHTTSNCTYQINTSNQKYHIETYDIYDNKTWSNIYVLPNDIHVSNINSNQIDTDSNVIIIYLETCIYYSNTFEIGRYDTSNIEITEKMYDIAKKYRIHNTIYTQYGRMIDDLLLNYNITLINDVSITLLDQLSSDLTETFYSNSCNTSNEYIRNYILNDTNIYNFTEHTIYYQIAVFDNIITQNYKYIDFFPKYIGNIVKTININYSRAIPHLILQTDVKNDHSKNYKHYMYSYDGLFKLYSEDNLSIKKNFLKSINMQIPLYLVH